EHVLVAARRPHGGLLRTLFSTPKARAEAARAEAEARGLLERFGLGAQADTRADQLTHAEQRLLAVATAAATGAGVLLLDEPSTSTRSRSSTRARASTPHGGSRSARGSRSASSTRAARASSTRRCDRTSSASRRPTTGSRSASPSTSRRCTSGPRSCTTTPT